MREDIQKWLKESTPLRYDDELTINIVETYLKHETDNTLWELEEDDIIWIMKFRLQYNGVNRYVKLHEMKL